MGDAAPGGRIVLGIDPGSNCTGWGMVRERSGVLEFLGCGTIRPAEREFTRRIGAIFAGLTRLIQEYGPGEAALENVFGGKSIQSALKLGQARGAAIAACASMGIGVFAYEPTLVKKTVAGAGRAEKSQVAFMVGRLLGQKPQWAPDASDALGIAICHLNQGRLARLAGGRKAPA